MAIRRPRNGRFLAVTLLVVATTTTATVTPAMAAPATGQIKLAGTADAIAGSYIVVLKDSAAGKASRVADRSADLADGYGAKVKQTFGSALNGFEASMSESAAKRLAADPSVAYVEQNQRVSLLVTQNNATWGIDRIDQKARPLSTTYTYNVTASNVTAYIIDTGIKYTHNDFGGRARFGYDAVGSGGVDCNGHGTHVAGTVGGTTYGVAKAVKLVGVRVLNCSGSGTNAGVIAGVNWVTQNAVKPAVANMSLGGGASSALDSAVSNSINSGVTYALAAGNSSANACNSSPARVASAITVGATTSTDAKASYSNYGTCLDIFAPGSSITSAWYSSNSATNTISGTSMASPHVAGAAALVLSANTGFSPAQVRENLVNRAVTGVVTSPGSGSPNRLLYVGP
ncbi:S8 family peptidase [Actinoplanes friuliensis]|uniref:Putative subtilase-family protease n=1 Tax=Actinoplanes friuliensis DSM 7358 TaxID=1246995 RepID=U5VTY0_9ACTN|nr:S8 family peptidase [Actinoplanes friuliensis]AGZ40329.1 putative subtilase-family protease [Actinoplanes friuliensis DSM 7358]